MRSVISQCLRLFRCPIVNSQIVTGAQQVAGNTGAHPSKANERQFHSLYSFLAPFIALHILKVFLNGDPDDLKITVTSTTG